MFLRAYDLILKKRNGGKLSAPQIDFFISGYTRGLVPDYQVAALLMAIWFKGMDEEETLALTRAMISSGDLVSLESIPGIKVDKHSTGGVGDTTTLVLAPLVAAAGAPVAKLSGRGLGHTGGTLDKLEAIPGFSCRMTSEELISAVKEIGVAVASQTANLVPADQLLYALRDVTATVDSMPLIAASVMSKKLAAGADGLVLDVKTGDGAFMKTVEEAFRLARTMVAIGRGAERKTVAVVTNMNQPLGQAVGNALEVEEAIHTLKGQGPEDLQELCLVLGSHMLVLARIAAEPQEARELLLKAINSGCALEKFKALIKNQHGDARVVDDLRLLPHKSNKFSVYAKSSGFVSNIKAEAIGIAAMSLGAGRENKEDVIDPAAGLVLKKKIGDWVAEGEPLAVLHAAYNKPQAQLDAAQNLVRSAFKLQETATQRPQLVYGVVE